MKETTLRHISSEETLKLLSKIPFFSDLALHDFPQYELLLQNSRLLELEEHEQLTQKGAIETRLYFLLEGQLYVFLDEHCETAPISELTPGQVLGALSIINKKPRNASLAAAPNGAKLLVTEFDIFGDLEDFSQIKLSTKLSLLRIVVNNTRWKLQVYKMADPEHPLAKKLDDIPQYDGTKGTLSELRHLTQQSKLLGEILSRWNTNQQAISNYTPPPKKKNKKGFLSFFKN